MQIAQLSVCQQTCPPSDRSWLVGTSNEIQKGYVMTQQCCKATNAPFTKLQNPSAAEQETCVLIQGFAMALGFVVNFRQQRAGTSVKNS